MSALMIRNDARLSVEHTPEAHELRESALSSAAAIGRVSTPSENEAAVAVQMEIARVMRLTEDARVECKAPALDFCRLIDSVAKEFREPLAKEQMRVTKLVADFQALELAKQRAAEQSRREELDKIEREKQAELAKANSHEELEKVQERYNEAARAVPAVKHVRAEGQKVSEDWDITVTDIHLLYRHHPNCVDLSPRVSEIKALVKAGTIPKGVHAQKKVNATVRLSPERKAIEV